MKNFYSWCLSAFLFLMPWQTVYIFREFNFTSFTVFGFEILFWLIAAMYFWKSKNVFFDFVKKKNFSSFQKIIFFSFLFLFASCLWSSQKVLALFGCIRIVEAFLLYYILTQSKYNKKYVFVSFLFATLIQSILGIFQFFTQSTFSFKWLGLVSHPVFVTGTSVIQSEAAGRWLRSYGAFPHPNVYGGYLAVALFFTSFVFLLLHEKGSLSKIQKYFLSILIVLQSTALFFSFSRSAWLAALFWFSTLFFISLRQKNKIGIFVCALFVVPCIFLSVYYFPLLKTRVEATSNHEVRSLEERKDLQKQALNLWKSHPWFGIGVGNYESVAASKPVHVVPFLFLVELGLVGFFLLAKILLKFKKMFPCPSFFWLATLFLSPLLLFDHYLYSLPVGILLLALFWAGVNILSFSTPLFFCLSYGLFSPIDKTRLK